MKNKALSKFLVLTLLGVGILGSVVAIKVYAAPVNLTTTVTNAAPSWSANPSDGGSSATAPTNVGANVAFSATATDANGNGYWLAICKSGGSITPSGTGAAPTCTAGNWCISSSASASGVANSCNYTALIGDAETNNWEAYACDNNGSGSTCSAAYTGSDPNGSPFHVNHAPTFGTMEVGDTSGGSGTIEPGDTVYFHLDANGGATGIDDNDADTTQDTVRGYICSSATTSMTVPGTCTGGSLICSQGTAFNPNTTAFECSSSAINTVPTSSGTKNFKVFFFDSHDFAGTGTSAQSYTVQNVAPSLSADSDGGSSSTTPTNVGSAVAFTGTASDGNGDSYWLIACPSAATGATNTGGAAPTCVGATAYCVDNAAVASGAQGDCNYTTLQGDPTSSDWEMYACDNNAGTSLCSALRNTTSPFETNHAPVIGTLHAGPTAGSDASVDPGNGTTGYVYFQSATVTDSDGDTVDMFVCDDATTAFDASGSGTCTGGATLCSVTGVSSGAAANCSKSNLVPIPTAHSAGIQTHIYLRDNNNTNANHFANSVSNKNYSVTDVAPTQGSISGLTNPLSPVAESSVNQSYSAVLTDNNGYADITAASGAIYVAPATLTGAGACTTASELNCYNGTTCALSGGSGATVTVTCGGAGNLITTWYNIAPSASWKARLNAVTDLGTTTFSSNEGTFTVNSLNAVGVNEAAIAYGSLGVGATSAAQTTTIKNVGNITTDALINGDLMCTDYATCAGSTIARAQQHWSPSSSWTWGTADYALLASATAGGSAATGCSDRTITVTTAHGTPTTSAIYWKIQIPSVQATGSYSGINYFTAEPNNCTGGN